MDDNKLNKDLHHGCWCCSRKTGMLNIGILLVLIGGFFIAKDLGWIAGSFSFWPMVAIFFGFYLILKRFTK